MCICHMNMHSKHIYPSFEHTQLPMHGEKFSLEAVEHWLWPRERTEALIKAVEHCDQRRGQKHWSKLLNTDCDQQKREQKYWSKLLNTDCDQRTGVLIKAVEHWLIRGENRSTDQSCSTLWSDNRNNDQNCWTLWLWSEKRHKHWSKLLNTDCDQSYWTLVVISCVTGYLHSDSLLLVEVELIRLFNLWFSRSHTRKQKSIKPTFFYL